MLTPTDLVNAARSSGYRYIRYEPSASKVNPYRAVVWWHGPRRATAVESAQDYCDKYGGTLDAVRNPGRVSGYDHVGGTVGGYDTRSSSMRRDVKPFQAQAAWQGPRRATASEAAQDYCDYTNGKAKMLTPADIKNPRAASGFSGVNWTPGGRTYRAIKNIVSASVSADGKQHNWYGPGRATAEQAAQDYCDYVNGQQSPAPAALKRAGHGGKSTPLPRDPDVEAALGIIRDAKARTEGAPGYVYIMVEECALPNPTEGKVGHSTNPRKRVGEVQIGNHRRLALFRCKPADRKHENELHAKYIKDNILQEWFRLTPALVSEFPEKLPEEIN